jgi:uncharacterized protein YggE
MHAPYRLKRYRFFEIGHDHYYYDDMATEEHINWLVQTSYLPLCQTIRDMISLSKGKFHCAISVSGTMIEMFEQFNPEMIDILKELGVQESSISTEFNMNPTYDWSSSDQRITGYQATTTITVSDIVLDSLGSILAESVKTGVNTVQGINYYSSSFDEAYQKALAKALKMARGKAEALSEELALAEGCELGGIQSINESNYNDSQRYAMKSANLAVAETAAEADMGTGAAISPGTITVKAQITVVYAIK